MAPKLDKTILARLLAWRNDSRRFVLEAFQHKPPNPGVPPGPSAQQFELIDDFEKHKRHTVRSGHGTGKDTDMAWLALKFFFTRPFAKVVVTAPTQRQLVDVFWSEISKWARRSYLSDELVIQRDKIFHKAAPKEWWIRGITANVKASSEEQAETLHGIHGDHLLLICDEASGIPDPVFLPLEGILTQEDNKVVLIGNMTRSSGYFYDTHFHPVISKLWKKYHWDSRESTNVDKEMVNYYLTKYGEDSNVFRVRVAGEPPLEDASTFIPLAWAINCVGNDIEVHPEEPTYLGVDVARFGDDDSVILPRKGNLIHPYTSYNGMDTMFVAAKIQMDMLELEADGAAIDEIGIGSGVVDWLYKHGYQQTVFGVNVSAASPDRTKYDKLRDYLWYLVREKCRTMAYSFPDVTVKKAGMDINIGHELANELASPRYDFNNLGGYLIEGKRQMKLRGIASPNKADALCLSEYFASIAFKLWDKQKAKKKLRQQQQQLLYSAGSQNRSRLRLKQNRFMSA